MKTIKTIFSVLALVFMLSCTTNEILQQEEVLQEKKPIEKECVFEFPAEESYDVVLDRINNPDYYWVYSRYLSYKHQFTLSYFPCDPNPFPNAYSDGNGMNFYDDIVWRWELYNEQDVKVDEGCFTTVCYATNVRLKKKIKSGNYYLKFIDFPEVTKEYNVIIP